MAGEQPLRDYLEPYVAELAAVTGADIVASLGDLLPDVDKAAMTGELAEELAASMRHGQHQGIVGWLERRPDRSYGRGASTSGRSPCRWRSGRADSTGWCRSRTASGSPTTSRARRRTSSRTRAISRCSARSATILDDLRELAGL